jgi:hypothetical protein
MRVYLAITALKNEQEEHYRMGNVRCIYSAIKPLKDEHLSKRNFSVSSVSSIDSAIEPQ